MDVNAFLTSYRDAWNSHDVDAIAGFFTDDGVYEDVAMARVNRGTDEIRAFAAETFKAFPDFALVDEGDPLVTDDTRYAVAWTMSGTHSGEIPGLPITNKSWSIRGVSVGEITGDKIARNADYWNMADFLVQVGILPPMPTT
jgi:steroid delta-isomerase-like uncharacterized protein